MWHVPCVREVLSASVGGGVFIFDVLCVVCKRHFVVKNESAGLPCRKCASYCKILLMM